MVRIVCLTTWSYGIIIFNIMVNRIALTYMGSATSRPTGAGIYTLYNNTLDCIEMPAGLGAANVQEDRDRN